MTLLQGLDSELIARAVQSTLIRRTGEWGGVAWYAEGCSAFAKVARAAGGGKMASVWPGQAWLCSGANAEEGKAGTYLLGWQSELALVSTRGVPASNFEVWRRERMREQEGIAGGRRVGL